MWMRGVSSSGRRRRRSFASPPLSPWCLEEEMVPRRRSKYRRFSQASHRQKLPSLGVSRLGVSRLGVSRLGVLCFAHYGGGGTGDIFSSMDLSALHLAFPGVAATLREQLDEYFGGLKNRGIDFSSLPQLQYVG